MFNFSQLPSLSLYIHLPWCVRKCPYCDFNSHQADMLPEQQYVDALLQDLESELPQVWGRRLTSIFIGGGTPSLFSPQAIEQLLSGVRARLPLLPSAEITMEANPGTLDNQHLRGYFEAGVNRLSIGVQSFNDVQLKAIGRIHDGDTARLAVESARDAGFANINIDLMFALPGQDLSQAMQDLQAAIDLQPEHISYYHLTIEPNTLFHHQPPSLPDDELSWQMQDAGQQLLAEAGFQQYEVSAYARDPHLCRHNLNYWRFGDYLGIGAGAHGKISDAQQQRIQRRWKHKHPQTYMQNAEQRLSGSQTLSVADSVFEFMLNALRLRDAIPFALFEQHTGLDRKQLLPGVQQAQQKDLLQIEGDSFLVTARGRNYLNDLMAMFLTD